MNGADFQLKVEQLCANMSASLDAVADMLNGLNPGRRQVEFKRRRVAILAALRSLKAMNPAQGSAAWTRFPALRLLEDLPSEQLRQILKSWASE